MPRVIGHSTLAMLVSARKLSIPAASRQPWARSASDMLPNWQIVTSSALGFSIWESYALFRGAPGLGNFADAGVSGDDEFAGPKGGLFEIERVGGQDLPAGDRNAEGLNRPHVGEFDPEAFMVVRGGGQPDSVVDGVRGSVTEGEDNLFADVHSHAAEKRFGTRREGGKRFEGEFVWNGFAFFKDEEV